MARHIRAAASWMGASTVPIANGACGNLFTAAPMLQLPTVSEFRTPALAICAFPGRGAYFGAGFCAAPLEDMEFRPVS